MSIRQINYGNSTITYSVIKTNRVKTSQIDVDSKGVTVRTPITKKDSEITRLIQDKSKWIYLKQLEFKKQQLEISKSLYKNNVFYKGKQIPLEVKTNQKTNSIEYVKGKFIVYLKKNYSKLQIKKLYDNWIFEKASKYLILRTKKISSKIGIKPSKIEVKSLKNRWGSVTEQGVLNLNSNLLKTPIAVTDYVIIHELCHFKINDHSERFWKYVGTFDLNYDYHKNWLDDHSKWVIEVKQ